MSESAETKVCEHCKGDGHRLVLHTGTNEQHRIKCFCQEELPFPVVIQPEDSGCAVAAVATAAQISYREARALIRMDRDLTKEGCYDFEIDEMMHALGYATQKRYRGIRRLNNAPRPWPCAPWAPVHLVMVRNLSNTAFHFVVMLADGRVLDPWWGVVQGLHRYPDVLSILGCFRVSVPSKDDA